MIWNKENSDAPTEPNQSGKVAAVVDVGVGEHDRVNGVGRYRERRPVLEPELLAALEQSAVDHDPATSGLDERLAAGDRPGAPEKAHAGKSFAPAHLVVLDAAAGRIAPGLE